MFLAAASSDKSMLTGDTRYANQRIFVNDDVDYVDESSQPYLNVIQNVCIENLYFSYLLFYLCHLYR